MRSRQGIIDLFSTFLQFEADYFNGWVVDARLRRSMQNCLAQMPDDSERFWAIYWHKRWQQVSTQESQGKGESKANIQPASTKHSAEAHLSAAHLSAYLQESCYWSVQKTIARVENPLYKLSDCFQVAIADVPRILKSCDPDQSTSLKTYASTAFSNTIRNYLRQRREVDQCNDWGFLLKLSRKQLVESLQNMGLGTEMTDRYVLAWSCFEDTYIPQTSPKLRQLTSPDKDTWNAIATLYNRHRQQLASPGPECSPETLERWLIYCVNQARAYLYPTVASLNLPKPGQSSGELQDDLPDMGGFLLADLIAQEETQTRQLQQRQINTVLEDAMKKLDPTIYELLQLYYQKGLTQQQIAKQMEIQQYTISRRLTKARETLLLALTRWSQETLHISPTSNVVKYTSPLLEEWLQVHFGR